MKRIILIIGFLLVSFVSADTTFFEDENDFLVMANSEQGSVSGGGSSSGGGGGISGYDLNKSGEISESDNDIKNVPDDENPLPKENPLKNNYFLFFVILALFCISFILAFRNKELIKNTTRNLKEKNYAVKVSRFVGKLSERDKKADYNSIRKLTNKKVYSGSGNFVGKIKEIILENNRIHCFKIKLDERNKSLVRGISVNYKNVNSIGEIVIIDDKILRHLEEYKS
ncbi:MAG: PRC-barrel domain-containing protein [archaeon]